MSRVWTCVTHLSFAFMVADVLVYLSKHLLEKRVLLFKPQRRVLA